MVTLLIVVSVVSVTKIGSTLLDGSPLAAAQKTKGKVAEERARSMEDIARSFF